MSNNSESLNKTLEHILTVNKYMNIIISDLSDRSAKHDNSKLYSPEKEMFAIATDKLKDLEFGSEEYKQALQDMGPALDHHYENNRHHPEHFKDGIRDMNLIDLVEMLVDWKASTERVVNGDIIKSIEYNSQRFDISDDLKKILFNTIAYLNW